MSTPPGNPASAPAAPTGTSEASAASAPSPPPAPLIAPTGNTSVDALASSVNAGAMPFQQLGDPKANTLDRITNVVNGAVGSLGAFDQLLNTGMALIPFTNMVPGMPAAFITVPHLGVPHAHAHPPSNGVPMPSFGATIGSGCVSVLIGDMPAARVLDVGIAPTCGGLAPIFEICTGSSNTFIGGARAARMALDLTRHCNPLGVSGKGRVAQKAEKESALKRGLGIAGMTAPLGASGLTAVDQAVAGKGAQAAMTAAQTAADAAALALSNLMGKDPGVEPGMGTLLLGNPSVLIGGFPMPDALAMLLTGWGLRKNRYKGKHRAGERKKQGPCKDGHPVDVVTGTAENAFVDYEAKVAPAFKFKWERYYSSGWSGQDGALGFGFRHVFQHELRLLRTRAIYVDARGLEYPIRYDAMGYYEGVFAGYVLEQHGANRFVLKHGAQGEFTFERASEAQDSARLVRHRCDGVDHVFRYASDGALLRVEQAAVRGGRSQLLGFVYDARGHLVEVRLTGAQGAASCIARYGYDAAGCLVASTDATGASMTYGYDDRRRMIRETDANGYSFSYRYDAQGRCVESVGQDGLWRVLLDYQPGRTVVTRADGGKWTFLYNAAQTITRIVDPYGGVSERVLGDDGRILREIDSGGRAMEWLYDEHGANTGRMDRWGNSWPTKDEAPVLPNPLVPPLPETPRDLQWGEAGHAELADTVLLPPDIAAAAASLFPRAACRPTSEHDAVGRVIARTDEQGRAERLQRDAAGNLLQLRDRDGRDYRYGIASWNLRESATDPLGNTVRYRYSAKQKLTAVVDANGNESAYAYDHKSRMTSVMRHGVVRETYAYDTGDRLIEKRDGAGNLLLRFEVGDNGLHSKCIFADGETHAYEYDFRGSMTRAATRKFDVTRTYDWYGRRTADLRDGRGVEHEYVDEQLSRTTYFGRFTVFHEAGVDGEVLIRTPAGGAHRLLNAADGQTLLHLGNGTHVLRQFDASGRCSGRLVWADGRMAERHGVQYQYSATGELQRVIDSAAGATEYLYDAAHRLIGASHEGWAVRSFEYDRGGNLVSTPERPWMRHGEGNRLSSASSGAYRYNARNHLAEEIGANGRRTTWHYDAMDLLVGVRWSDRNEAWGAEYDGLCRRVAKTLGQARTEFYWDGDRLMAERGPHGQLRLYVYPNAKAYLPFMFIDYPSEDASPESGQAYFVFCNQVGLPEWIEDTQRRKVWQAAEIDPYGAIRVAPGNTIEYALRWPGHYFDEETALHYNRFRSYCPSLRRYLQSDPAGQSGGINLYAYTANPLVNVDVLGLKTCQTDGEEGSDDGNETGHRQESTPETDESTSAPENPD
ncbi:MAG: DUF6531 domain-containing protein, partial [Paraburkholderia sp.]|nr:DUF6531 domain-containing protein [Paraburkholderia sp.]